MKKIHVGLLLSYDYEKLKLSLPPVYAAADKIFIALDKDNRTWTGKIFEIDDGFFKWLTEFDVEQKIELYKDDFYKSDLTPIQNDTRERHMLSIKMGIGNWLVQVDSDEIFINFTDFVTSLRKHDRFLKNPKKTPVQIAGFLINIYKYLEDGILYVDKPTKVLLATNYPNYKYARQTKERIIYTQNVLLHECLSRTEKELRFKFENWGHAEEINDSFFDKWRMANAENYKEIKNTFYLDPNIWESLGYFNSKDLKEIQKQVQHDENLEPSNSFLKKKNFGQWFKHLGLFKPNKKVAFETYFDDERKK